MCECCFLGGVVARHDVRGLLESDTITLVQRKEVSFTPLLGLGLGLGLFGIGLITPAYWRVVVFQ